VLGLWLVVGYYAPIGWNWPSRPMLRWVTPFYLYTDWHLLERNRLPLCSKFICCQKIFCSVWLDLWKITQLLSFLLV